MSSFGCSHYISRIGEGGSHCLVTNELGKENGHKNRFSPISERTNSFTEIKTGFWIAKAELNLCALEFLFRRPWSKGQDKLWRGDFVQSLEGEALFKPVEFGSRFSPGAGAQSFFDGRIGLSVPFLIDCWLSASSEFVGCWLITCSAPMKLSSVLAASMLLASSCCKLSSGFTFVVGGCWCLLIALLVCRRWWGSVIGMPSWLDVVHCRSTYSKFAIKKYEVSLYLWRL